uniref:Uncharacterized protein n=1 Tax=Lepeophtheirus salmonis TaxID=72036 RepID=A0A0K2T7Z6_LEPSM
MQRVRVVLQGVERIMTTSRVTIHLCPNKERNAGLDTTLLRAIPRETDLKKTD